MQMIQKQPQVGETIDDTIAKSRYWRRGGLRI
ncbi:Uncharacterized protein ytoI [Listeria monocytogenes]|nr:Uncharacterized protein ytoI [Listeria monocytogenes]